MFIKSILLIGNMMVGPFMPGVTMDRYERMVLDINQTRAMVRTVIPSTTIENETRCKAVMLEMDNMADAVNEYNAVFSIRGKEIVHLYLSHGSTPEDFQKVLGQMDSEKEKAQKKIIETRFRMKTFMTTEEWKALFSPQG